MSGAHDYTEGASAVDIDAALARERRQRRDSAYHAEDDIGGHPRSVFDGPGSVAIPSSVSRMGHGHARSWSRRVSLDRRHSGDSARSIGAESVALSDGEDDDEAPRGRSPEATRHGVFESLSHFFGAPRQEPHRRGSRSRSRGGSEYGLDEAADEDDGDSRWGYASSEEDVSDDDGGPRVASPVGLDSGSYPPTPDEEGLPALASDAMFGDETRIDIAGPLEDDLHPPPPGPPSRQNVYVADEDAHLRFLGYETSRWRSFAWRVGCVLSLGALGLLGHWFPRLWLRWVAHEKAFKDTKHGFVVIEVGLRIYQSSASL
jgi:cation-transporting ATPase 13A2